MTNPVYQIDAFTDHAFAGNPAAVVFLKEIADEKWMQSVASEMNLAETAFLRKIEHVDHSYTFELRWFTPEIEVDLCGHATLASAHALWTEGVVADAAPIAFLTRSGILTAQVSEAGWITLDFPSTPASSVDPPANLESVLGAAASYLGRTEFDYLVEIRSLDTLLALKPDLVELAKWPVRGVIVTSRGGREGSDFTSRFFAPSAGVPEDPVTGSAHCCLAPYWGEHLGETEMIGHQASPRGGFVRVGMRGERVLLKGQAVTVLKGELLT